jgi:hypothetical protein
VLRPGWSAARRGDKIRDGLATAMRSCLRALCRSLEREKIMSRRGSIGACGFLALCATISGASAWDDAKYPDLRGQWNRVGVPRWVLAGQKAPLTPEYQKVFDANLADMNKGGQGNVPSWYCLPQGMPMMMNAYDPVEFVVTPDITYILISHVNDSYRRVYTDGRGWPEEIEPTFAGYSIGKWVDENGDGRFDTLEIETRSIKMPHAYDASGLPFHEDGEGVVKERIYLDKADSNIVHDEITSIDHALTQPWTVTKTYRRDPKVKQPTWQSAVCAADNSLVRIGEDAYFTSPDGYLMPITKDQAPPDLRYLKKTQK